MDYLRRTIGSSELAGVFDLPLALRDRRVEVIILPADTVDSKKQIMKPRFDFVDAPPLPESFFDPLSEEELQAWGL